jgi:uncharacterized coiled-coil DUF342 family protein
MNDEQLDDLKQFIDSRISQSEQRIRDDLNQDMAELKRELNQTNKTIDGGFTGIAEAIEQINNRLDRRDQEVDQRLTKLEQQIAA